MHVLGIDNKSESNSDKGFVLHKNSFPMDVYAENDIMEVVKTIEPDVVILYHDPWVINRFLQPVKKINPFIKLIGYIPFDGDVMNLKLSDPVQQLDKIVLFSSYGTSVIKKAYAGSGSFLSALLSKIKIIPHGVEQKLFYPVTGSVKNYQANRLASRKMLFPDQPEMWEGFWCLNSCKNEIRKRIDLTLKGFAKFATGKPPQVKLFLNMGYGDRWVNIKKQAYDLGIADRLIFMYDKMRHPDLSIEDLNLVYNACDVGINTSMGEGWGLVSYEHAMTGAPQIVPAHSACKEIWEDAALLLPSKKILYNSGCTEGGLVDPDDIANALEILYSNNSVYVDTMLACKAVTEKEAYQVGSIINDWNNVLQEVHYEFV